LGLFLQLNFRHCRQQLPHLVREAEQVAQNGQRAVDRGRRQRRAVTVGVLASDGGGGQPPRLVLADPGRRDVNQWHVRAEGRLQVFENPPVLCERPLAGLRREVSLTGICESQGRPLLRELFDLEEQRGERLLRVVSRPLRLVDALLLTAHLDGKAPGFVLRALAGNFPESLTDLLFRHPPPCPLAVGEPRIPLFGTMSDPRIKEYWLR